MRHLVCLISLATSMLEGWGIFHLKGDIHSIVSSTSSFLCDIREPRYNQNKMGYEIKKIENIELKYSQENIDFALLKKFLSKDNPSQSPNSQRISSQNTIFKQLKKKIT